MGTEIRNAVIAADQNARYDKEAKRLLSSRIILAHILAKAVDEFREMEPEKIQAYIEGDPFVGTVPAEPGRTNAGKKKRGQRTAGLNTEDTEIGEGTIWFDIIFYVRMKDGISQIIVNLEIQKDELPEHKVEYELHRLLSVLLSMELSVAEKLEIVEREYHIPINGEMKEGLNAMCNLSQGIMEKGIEKGGVLGEKRSSELAVCLVEAGRIDDLVRAAVDEGYRHKLFAEFGIS